MTIIRLEIGPEVERKLRELQDLSGANCNAEVIKRALAVYDFLLKHHHNGGAIRIHYPNETFNVPLTP